MLYCCWFSFCRIRFRAKRIPLKYKEHIGLLNAKEIIGEAEEKFAKIFGRKYSGLTEEYRTDDADYIIVTLGSIAGLVRETVDKLRNDGKNVGLLRIRYLRPFPNEEIAGALKNAKAAAVLEKDISFGNEETVYTNVNSALKKQNHFAGIASLSLGGKQKDGCFCNSRY